MADALTVQDLRKRYGTTEALKGVDLSVGEGELVGLLGPNGAGKSTLVKIACGLVRASGGSARVAGAPAGSATANRSLGYLAELFRFPDWLSADELLQLHQKLAGSRKGSAERRELLELVGLDEVPDRRVGAMSKGMQQRLGIAQAMIGEPRLLLLDEPTSALDPAGRRTVRRLLEELRSRGVSVLLNSHLLSEVELVCDRVAIIARGEVVAAGSPAELSHAGGVEVVTGRGARVFAQATREEIPRIVRELVQAGEDVYEVRVVRSIARGHLPGSGRRQVRGIVIVAGFALRESLRRRVFVVVALLTVAFLALYGLGTWQISQEIDEIGSTDGVEGRGRGGRDAARPLDVRDALPGRDPRRLPDARTPSAATLSAACCSRWSCARCRAATSCSAASWPPRACASST